MTDKFVQELQELFRFSVATRCRMLQAATGCAKLNLSHIREVYYMESNVTQNFIFGFLAVF